MSYPLARTVAVGRRWNPWRALRDRSHLRLVFAPLPPQTGGGAIVDLEDGRVVVLDERLDRRHRNAVLGHELVHDERMLFPPDTPPAFVAKEESYVNREVARRLVPLEDLDALVGRIVAMGDPVHLIDVIEEFDVPLDVAQRALWLLGQWRSR